MQNPPPQPDTGSPQPAPPTQGTGGTPSATRGGQPGLGAAVRAASLVTLASRFAGMLRDVLVVQVFGATALASAFAAAFQIPNLFRRLFGEGALSAAFIPEYAVTAKRSQEDADRLSSYILTRLAWITAAITIVAELIMLVLLVTLPPNPDREISLRLMMMMFPFMPAICIAAILSAMLQVHGRFGASMSGAFFVNLFIVSVCVFCLITGRTNNPVVAYVLCIATVLSGFTQCIWFSRLLRQYSAWRPDNGEASAAARKMLKNFVPVMVGLGGLQISSFLDLSITMYPIWVGKHILGFDYPLDEKSNIILRSTSLIFQFPLGVFGAAVATAAFPMLARAADNGGLFLDTVRRGLRLSIFIGLPASIGLILVREDVTRVLFSLSSKRGFDEAALARSADVLLAFAPSVWAFALNQLLTRVFYAKGDTITPVRVSAMMVGVSFVLSFIGMWFLREAALGLAATITAVVQTIILSAIAKKRFCPPGEPILDGPTRRSIARVTAAVLVMAAIVLLTQNLWPLETTEKTNELTGVTETVVSTSRWMILLRMACYVGLGAGAYAGEAVYSRSPELAWLTSRGNKAKGQYRDLVVE
ncbi:MAG: murein biosynthesis integral membrane protein MurJ [Phycisphaerales bacterium]